MSAYLLEPPRFNAFPDLLERQHRTLTVRVGDGTVRFPGRGPDPYNLLPPGDLKNLHDTARRLGYSPKFKLIHWLHLCGPGWGIDVKPWLLGAFPYNLSAQARVEGLARRLSDAYLRTTDRLVIEATEYARVPDPTFPHAFRFVDEVSYKFFKNTKTSQNFIVRASISATDPSTFARTFEAVSAVELKPGQLWLDAIGAAPDLATEFLWGARSKKP